MKNCLSYNFFNKQRASALITALMLVSVVIASVTLVFSLQRVFLYKTRLAEQNEQALELALNAESWAKEEIWRYAGLNDEMASSVTWPIIMPAIKLNNGQVTISIEAIQNLYNLNQVRIDSAGFSRLIHFVEPELSQATLGELVHNTVVWQSRQLANDNTDSYYQSLSPPYRAAQRLFSDKSELRLVKGFNSALYNRLSPYIIALPERAMGRIDLNTATVAAFILLSSKLSINQIQAVLAVRDKNGGFKTVDEFLQLPALKNINLPENRLLLRSYFFRVKTCVQYKKASVEIQHTYQLKEDNDTIELVSLSRMLFPV